MATGDVEEQQTPTDTPDRSIDPAKDQYCSAATATKRVPAEPPQPRFDPVDLVSRSVDLWRQLRGASEERGLWTLIDRRVDILSSTDLTIESEWLFDSDQVRPLIPHRRQVKYLIPLPERLSGRSLKITIRNVVASRDLEPIPLPSMASLFEQLPSVNSTGLGNGGDLPQTPIVSLTTEELLSCPLIRMCARLSARASLSQPISIIHFMPVSWIDTEATEPFPLRSLSIGVPSFATADSVVLECKVNWSLERKDLEDSLAQWMEKVEAQQARPNSAASYLLNDVNTARDRVSGALTEFQEAVTKPKTVDGSTVIPTAWYADIQDFRNRLDATIVIRDDQSRDFRCAVENANQLINMLKQADTAFLVHCAVEGGLVQLPPRLGASRKLLIARIIVPFSTEQEPSTQGKRSSAILMLLALVLLGISLFDASWLPFSSFPTPDASQLNRITDGFIATLILFPAVLYSQFFQSRPRTDLGNQAQMGTFALLSLIFALPIIPAVLLITNVSTWIISITLLCTALIAGTASTAVWIVFTAEQLRRLRWRVALMSSPRGG